MVDFNKEDENLNRILFPRTLPGQADEMEDGFKGYVVELFIRCEMNELDRAYRLVKAKVESICPQPFLPKYFTGEEQQLKTKRFNLEGAIEKLFKFEKEKRQEQTSKEQQGKGVKDKLTHKQQILLLKQLGFFGLEVFTHLNEKQKGILVGYILNRDEKNSEDNIRYLQGTRVNEETKKIFAKDNLKAVNELLESLGLKQYNVS